MGCNCLECQEHKIAIVAAMGQSKSPWIRCADRMPTEEGAKPFRKVLILAGWRNTTFKVPTPMVRTDPIYNLHPRADSHWMYIPPLPPQPEEEEEPAPVVRHEFPFALPAPKEK